MLLHAPCRTHAAACFGAPVDVTHGTLVSLQHGPGVHATRAWPGMPPDHAALLVLAVLSMLL
jgi:hypothetical protein